MDLTTLGLGAGGVGGVVLIIVGYLIRRGMKSKCVVGGVVIDIHTATAAEQQASPPHEAICVAVAPAPITIPAPTPTPVMTDSHTQTNSQANAVELDHIHTPYVFNATPKPAGPPKPHGRPARV